MVNGKEINNDYCTDPKTLLGNVFLGASSEWPTFPADVHSFKWSKVSTESTFMQELFVVVCTYTVRYLSYISLFHYLFYTHYIGNIDPTIFMKSFKYKGITTINLTAVCFDKNMNISHLVIFFFNASGNSRVIDCHHLNFFCFSL